MAPGNCERRIRNKSEDIRNENNGLDVLITRKIQEDGQGWPFGGTIFYSDVYRVLLQVPGVLRLRDNQLVIWLDEERQTFCRDVEIGTGELVWNDGHDIRVAYA